MKFAILLVFVNQIDTSLAIGSIALEDSNKLSSLPNYNIEYNLRELGFGDVTVNKKMKDLNKVLYDILLKIEIKNKKDFTLHINHTLICKYFPSLSDQKSSKYIDFETYFLDFYNFCFEIPVKNMIRDIINKYK